MLTGLEVGFLLWFVSIIFVALIFSYNKNDIITFAAGGTFLILGILIIGWGIYQENGQLVTTLEQVLV